MEISGAAVISWRVTCLQISLVKTRHFKYQRRERQRRREIVRENSNVTLHMSGVKYLDVLLRGPTVRKLRLALLENVSNISHILPPFRPRKMIFLISLGT